MAFEGVLSTPLSMLVHMLSQRLPPENYTGAPLQALKLGAALRDLGHEVRFFTTRPRGCAAAPAPDTAVTLLRYPTLPGLRSPLRFARTLMAHEAIAAADVVHGHALSPMTLACAVRTRRRDAPLLIKPSLGGDHDEGEVHKLYRALPHGAVNGLLRRVDAFAVLDDHIEADLLGAGVSAQRIHRVSNGVDRHEFSPLSAAERGRQRLAQGFDDDDRVLLFAGQLTPRKGVPELLEAWGRVAPRHPRAVLLLAGSGPLAASVQLAEAQHGGALRWLGEVASIAPLLQIADALILPSRVESFGHVVVEAMACGVPVAATAVGIAREVLRPGDNGWLIPAVDAAILEAVLEAVLASGEPRDALAARCRDAVAALDFQMVARRYEAIYAQLVRH